MEGGEARQGEAAIVGKWIEDCRSWHRSVLSAGSTAYFGDQLCKMTARLSRYKGI